MDEDNNRSLGSLVKALTEDLSTLIRSEIALAKLEIAYSVRKLGISGVMFVTAGFVTLSGVIFLMVTALLGLIALGLAPWLAALLFAILLFMIAAVLFIFGRKKMRDVDLVPRASMESVKTDISSLKAELNRPRRNDD